MYMLDTNTVSLAIRGRAPRAVAHLRDTKREDIVVSIVTAMKLRFGLAKNPATRSRDRVEQFLDTVVVLPLDRQAERPYGEIRAALERAGHPIGAHDTIIAAHALSVRAILVTNNVREFRRVKGLKCEDWTA